MTTLAGFAVTPDGPENVTLRRGAGPGYPGVQVRNERDMLVHPQKIRVILPAGRGLRFEAEAGTAYGLTVCGADGTLRLYFGVLSPDRQSLTFSDVDLGFEALGDEVKLWVAVTASSTAPLGNTSLQFTIGDQIANSTAITVVSP